MPRFLKVPTQYSVTSTTETRSMEPSPRAVYTLLRRCNFPASASANIVAFLHKPHLLVQTPACKRDLIHELARQHGVAMLPSQIAIVIAHDAGTSTCSTTKYQHCER